MANRDTGSSAMRRQERRLRSFWRHEQMAIQMALAAAFITGVWRTSAHWHRRLLRQGVRQAHSNSTQPR